MKADLLDGDQVILEDSGGGGGDGGVLANQSILMRGLVVRSRGNHIRLHLHSRRPQPGSMLLRYQGERGGGGVFSAACWGPDMSRLPALVAPVTNNVVAVDDSCNQ